MPDISYIEPAEIRAGDTTTWKKTVADYPPADGWTLKYALRNTASKITLTGTTSGTDYLITITAAVSASYTPGRYDWVSYVTKGSAETLEQHTIDEGSVTVTPNLSADVVYDARSDARKIYDDLITKFKTLAAGAPHVQSYNVAGRGATYRNMKDMTDVIQFWYKRVRDEEDAEAIANGNASSRHVGVRLTRI